MSNLQAVWLLVAFCVLGAPGCAVDLSRYPVAFEIHNHAHAE